MTKTNSEDQSPDQILVPLDGSALADRALELAKDIALQRSAQVSLVKAVPTEDCLQESHRFLLQKSEFFKKYSVACSSESLVGDPVDVITKKSSQASLIVMSSHGHSQFDRLILGSTAEKVVRQSDCDILVLRERQPRLKDIRKVLVPLDGHWLSHQALPQATEMCSALGASLILARIHEADKLSRNLSSGKEETAQQKTYLNKVASEVEGQVEVEVIQEFGPIARGLLQIAERKDVNLIVMTSHGRGGFNRWVCGGVTETLLRSSNIPVLVVRSRPKETPAISPVFLQPFTV